MATTASGSGSIAEQHNLLPKLMPNLDRHLLYPLLNFTNDEDSEQSVDQMKLLLALLQPTNMIDFVGDLYKRIHGLDEMPDEYKQKREEVLNKRDELEEATRKISDLLDDENVVTNLRSDKVQNLQYLEKDHGVTVEMVDKLYEFGRFQYDCGIYGHASELLYRFRVLVSAAPVFSLRCTFRNADFSCSYCSRPITTRPARPPGASSPARSCL
jgi:translation initiation factor 3 subunit E